jgi:acetyl-CoA acetyltransferase
VWTLRDKYAIAGIGYTRYSRDSGTTVLALALEACRNAVADAGLAFEEVDGVVSYHMGDSVPAMAVATGLGLPAAHYAVDFCAGGNAANLVVQAAAQAIEAGLATNVLCYRAMNGRSGYRLGGSRDVNAAGFTQFTAPYGWMTYPQAMAMWCRRHMVKYGTTSAELGTIAVTCRRHATLNERAMMRKPITLEDHQAAPVIVEPFRLLDICLETDGGCAVLVTSSGRARNFRHQPVYIMGAAYGGGPNQGDDLFDAIRWPDHAHNYSKYIAHDLWKSAGVTPQDVDVALIYDCFTHSVIMQLEGFGFCPEGEGGRFVQGGRIDLGGELPLNTHGGLLSEAYIHGLNHVVEAVEQLRGQAGARQVKDAEIALTTAGAMTVGSALVLRR